MPSFSIPAAGAAAAASAGAAGAAGAGAAGIGALASAAPYLSLAGTAVGAIGSIEQGNAEAAQAKYQAQVARNNATIAGNYARLASATGEVQAYNQGLANREKMGALVAGLAGSNLDVNTGTPAAVREGEEERGYTDVETVRNQAALKAYGYNIESVNQTAQSRADTAEAGYDTEGGFLKAGATMLSGLSTVSPKFQSLFDSANSDGFGDWSPRPA